jgi:anti-anti-sigma factor
MKTQHSARPPVVIRAGDLDAWTAPGFTARLHPGTWAGAATVVIDLSDTEFFDEAGIEAIIAAAGQAAASGCRLAIACAWWPILRMLQAAGLDKTIDIADSASQLTMGGSTRPGTRFPRATAAGGSR